MCYKVTWRWKMAGSIRAEDLLPETRRKLKLAKGLVPQKVVVLGKLLQAVDGLTTRDALWSLRTAHSYIRGYGKKKTITGREVKNAKANPGK